MLFYEVKIFENVVIEKWLLIEMISFSVMWKFFWELNSVWCFLKNDFVVWKIYGVVFDIVEVFIKFLGWKSLFKELKVISLVVFNCLFFLILVILRFFSLVMSFFSLVIEIWFSEEDWFVWNLKLDRRFRVCWC